MKITDIINRQNGGAAVLALIGLAVGSLLVASFLTLASTSLKISSNFESAAKRQYAAEAGMEYAVWGLQTRSVAEYSAQVPDTDLVINDCTVAVDINLKDIDPATAEIDQPKGKRLYTIESTAQRDGKSTTVTSDVAITYDAFSFAVIALDGDITMPLATGVADPYIHGAPAAKIDEGDIFARDADPLDGGDEGDIELGALAGPDCILGDASAMGTIPDGQARIFDWVTEGALLIPTLDEQLNDMDIAIYGEDLTNDQIGGWQDDAAFVAPDTPTHPVDPQVEFPGIFDVAQPAANPANPANPACSIGWTRTWFGAPVNPWIPCGSYGGQEHVLNLAANPLCNINFTNNVCCSILTLVGFTKNFTDDVRCTQLDIGIVTSNFGSEGRPLTVTGNCTIGLATVNFWGPVTIGGDLTCTALANVRFHDSVTVNGTMNISAGTFVFDGPVQVGGDLIIGLASATFNDTVRVGDGVGTDDLNMTTSVVSFGDGTVDWANYTSHASSNDMDDTTFEIKEVIAADTPAAGVIRITDEGTSVESFHTYTSWAGSTFSGVSPALTQDYDTSDTCLIRMPDDTVYVSNGNVNIFAAGFGMDVDFRSDAPLYVSGNLTTGTALSIFPLDVDFDAVVDIGNDLVVAGAVSNVGSVRFGGPTRVGRNMAMGAGANAFRLSFGTNSAMNPVSTAPVRIGGNLSVTGIVAANFLDINSDTYVIGNFDIGGLVSMVSAIEIEGAGNICTEGMFRVGAMGIGTGTIFDLEGYVYAEEEILMGGVGIVSGIIFNVDEYVYTGDTFTVGGGGAVTATDITIGGTLAAESDILVSESWVMNGCTVTVGGPLYGGGNFKLGSVGLAQRTDVTIGAPPCPTSSGTPCTPAYIVGNLDLDVVGSDGHITFNDACYIERNIEAAGFVAGGELIFGSTLYGEGHLDVDGLVASSKLRMDDIAYFEEYVDFDGTVTFGDSFDVGRMLISENLIQLASDTDAVALPTDFIPLIISTYTSPGGSGDPAIEILERFDTPGLLYAPNGWVNITGFNNYIYGCVIGKEVIINPGAAGINEVVFPEDLRDRAVDLPGRTTGEETTDIHGWHIAE